MSIFTKLKTAREARKAARAAANVGKDAAVAEGQEIVAAARKTGKMTDEQFTRLRALKEANGLWWEDVAAHKGEVNDLCVGKAPQADVLVLSTPVVEDSPQIVALKAQMAEARAKGYLSTYRYKQLKALVKADKALYWTDFCVSPAEAMDLTACFEAFDPAEIHRIETVEKEADEKAEEAAQAAAQAVA